MKNQAGQSGKSRIITVFFILILMGLTLIAGWWLGQRNPDHAPLVGQAKAQAASPARPRLPLAREDGNALADDRLADVAEATMPAVVNIFSEKVVQRRQMANPFFPFPMGPGGRARRSLEHSLGSGVIVTPDGYILTNNHMVEGADSIKVATSDKRQFTARVIGADPMTDLAVLKIEGSGLPTLSLADSDKVRVGQTVLAIGNPFGLSGTVTLGIVSARGRSHMGITDYEDFIQTDAAINPGNSGGALVDLRGNLIGINTAIFSQSGGSNGIGFAIPANLARRVMDSLVQSGTVKRGYLGVMLQDMSPELAAQFGLKEPHGALVADVLPDSPAAEAGIKPGDIILTINGKEIETYSDLRNRVADQTPGENLEVKLWRDGEEKTVSVTLRERPAEEARAGMPGGPGPKEPEEQQVESAGFKVANLTPAIADQLGIKSDTQGVVVVDLEQGGPADRAGLQVGDIVLGANRARVSNVADFIRASQVGNGQALLLHLSRSGQSLFLLIPLE